MPLLDPSYQYTLFTKFKTDNPKYSKHFFLRYLKIASQNLYRNFQTIEASIQFKKDLINSMPFLNEIFGCNFTPGDFDDPTIKDYYRFLFDHIDPKYKSKILKKQKGTYGYFYDPFTIYFFMPQVEFQSGHYWLLTNTPVAILVIDSINLSDDEETIIKMSNLEIDLMTASGFTIVLCIRLQIYNCNYEIFLKEMIATHSFAEIHLNLDCKYIPSSEIYDDFFTLLNSLYDKVQGYFYLYSMFVNDDSIKAKKEIKLLKQKPRFRSFFFSVPPKYALNVVYKKITTPFYYCKTGFEEDKIFVCLSNVPLYMSENETKDFLVTETTGTGIGYISTKDFLNFTNSRVKIIFDNNNRYIERYIDFDDIHNINIDLYIDKTIYLAKTNQQTIDEIKDIFEIIDEKTYEDIEFKQEKIFTLFKEKKIQKGLTYVSYAFIKNARKRIPKFELHENQILAAFEACKISLLDSKDNNKGVIYQVETGEGKSCIIQIIAAVLALMKKTVHIASSNINLSNRDYQDSYDFFKLLGLSSAVLLHYDELPFVDSNENIKYDQNLYPSKFFGSELFKNSLNMNLSVCGINDDNKPTKNTASIIFSTFINLESLYLKMMEMCPSYIFQYFMECSLLIDEADSMLIDELANGTILSRTIKSNANDILKYVYQSRIDNNSARLVYKKVKEKWPKCIDLKLDDIKYMFKEIDIVNQKEFTDGKKYSIEEVELKEEKTSLIDIIKNTQDTIEEIKEKCENQVKKFFLNMFKKKNKKQKNKKNEDTENSDELTKEEDDNKNNEKLSNNKMKIIVPFDYDHKGILEPYKEFSGFVQQFIAIKEMINNKDNENMAIKDISMNYLYVSHPIFINLYNNVVGLTGTIGNKFDKQILKDQYNLTTMKIPRNSPNKRIEFPVLLCKDINERNRKIVEEIINFNKKDFPVLVIFQDLNEISAVLFMLISKGIKNINIFDGKDEKIKPDIIAGLKGSVSLGTNICGRGTDIKKPTKPLHVIISYFTSNSRVISQAFGRTARQGQDGSVRIICIKDQYILPLEQINSNDFNDVLDNFKFKNKLQIYFIEKFRNKRKWIFFSKIKHKKLKDEYIEAMRETKININRIKACEFEFPICMSVSTFLQIQAQKIFSLYNCPNCKYTWMLFQKYIREMILESWSLFIDKADKKYFRKKYKIMTYSQYLTKKIPKLYGLLGEYLPDSYDENNYKIMPTFMHIYNKVVKIYEPKIMSFFPDELMNVFKQTENKRYCSFTFGFKPYELIDNSGARINTADGTDQDKYFITDPELKYMQKMPEGRSILISITQRIDDIFNWICRKINEVIGAYIGLRFFLRRTLGGCEFGVCFDFELENVIPDDKKDHNCLFDKDPLLVFTINVKSRTPVLAGILIIGLVYIASIGKTIAEWVSGFYVAIAKKILKKTIIELASLILQSQIEQLCDTICSFLSKILLAQSNKMDQFSHKTAIIFKTLSQILNTKDFSFSGDQFYSLFKEKANLKIKSNFGKKFINENLPFAHFAKIGFLLLLCFASFMVNFHFHCKALKYDESKVADEYDKNQNTKETLEKNQKMVNREEFGKIDSLDLKLKDENK